jgi:hypothetical protein
MDSFKSIRTAVKVEEEISMGRRGKISITKKANNNELANDFIRQFNR